MAIMNICELEVFLNSPTILNKFGKLIVTTQIEKNGETIKIGEVDLKGNKLIINKEFAETVKIDKDKRVKFLYTNKSILVNALMRAAILKPDLEQHRKIISQWDDVIFGLDTNLFYNCAITSFVLDYLLKIPSGNYIDGPDWVTLIFSKVGMGEIENRAGHSKIPLHRRQALRAIQELMIINLSKDLEGVSLFITGLTPPEINYSDGETNTIRDSIIREQFRELLKKLDFHKGSYFLTQDFNNSVLAEAEGLRSMYIKKPELKQIEYTLFNEDKVNISEIIYELAVSFQPLFIEAEGLSLKVESLWDGKTLEDWEDWKINVEWIRDDINLKHEIDRWMNSNLPQRIITGWGKLKERYIKWTY